jgi:uncharacterized membrane protein YwzB
MTNIEGQSKKIKNKSFFKNFFIFSICLSFLIIIVSHLFLIDFLKQSSVDYNTFIDFNNFKIIRIVHAKNSIPEGAKLINPLAEFKPKEIDITIVIGRIIGIILAAIGVISLIVFIIGAYYYLTAGGNQERIKKGTTTLVWAILGIVLAFGSYAILSFLIEQLTFK